VLNSIYLVESSAMNEPLLIKLVFGLGGVFLSAMVLAAGNTKHGQELYESRCGGCHSIDQNRVGPAHQGVFGRKAGSASDYSYSVAVKNSDIVWNETTLDAWLTNPEALIPGQKMGYSVTEAINRADLIAYLKKISSPVKN
jgi:cytochrome c